MPAVKVEQAPEGKCPEFPVFQHMEEVLGEVRKRAFELFTQRGGSDGHAMEDWLLAEHEICWPSAELAEEDAAYVLQMSLPGFEPAEITVTAAPGELIVHASQQTTPARGQPTGSKLRWSEFRSNDVYRRIELDERIDVDGVTASFRNGLLRVVARKAKDASRTLPVAVAA